MSFQQMTVVGNLGQDPEMRYLPDGRPVTNFSMACNRKWTNKDGSKGEETLWLRVAVYGGQAEACSQYLSKGRQVLVIGRLKPDPDTGGPRIYAKKDGTAGAQFELTATSVQFLGGKGDAAPGQTQAAQKEDSEGIPF